MEKNPDKLVEELALLYGVLPEHQDGFDRTRKVSFETLFSVIRCLGASLESVNDLPSALREKSSQEWSELTEPVSVLWGESPLEINLKISAEEIVNVIDVVLFLESGEERVFHFIPQDFANLEQGSFDDKTYFRKKIKICKDVPWGYHRLDIRTSLRNQCVFVISSPSQAYLPNFQDKGGWGVFTPLYALRSDRDWGAGDFFEMERLLEWVGQLGGSCVSTLPFLPSFLSESFEPSPYAPVSRLFWNEFFLDIERIPELQICPRAKEVLSSSQFEQELRDLRSSCLVDYRRLMVVKRKILEMLADSLLIQPSSRRDQFEQYVESHPMLRDYARFRALHEKLKIPWVHWPDLDRMEKIPLPESAKDSERYHRYVQWLSEGQVQMLSEKAQAKGVGLYLDFPLGVHPDGFDAWREREIFASEVSVGAPPDHFFVRGQNWAFSPLHPRKIRDQGYGYFIAALRHHLRTAKILRIDHVMGLHRLYWIPQGMSPDEGCYVRYSCEDFYAILCLESQRAQSLIVGEDLGTVPPEVRTMMQEKRIFRTYVAQFGLTGDKRMPLGSIPSRCVAGLGTHDTATFAGFWTGLDIQDRNHFGLINADEAKAELRQREDLKRPLVEFLMEKNCIESDAVSEIIQGCLKYLAMSKASLVLVNLEDLWEEIRQQNVPGTGQERANWMGKMRYSLEEFFQRPEVDEILKKIDQLRHTTSVSKNYSL